MPDFSTAERAQLAKKGEARRDGSYPIRNAKDLADAYKDYIRTGRPADVAAWIGKRARTLQLPNPVSGNQTSYDAVIERHSQKAST